MRRFRTSDLRGDTIAATESRVTIHMAASLDGFIARKDGRVDWLETADEFAGGETLDARKENEPAGSAVERAASMGIALLTEAQYRALQTLGEFDAKTSSWVHMPDDVRALGGALFCDRRHGKVFVHHNGAQSYDAARGFRGIPRV